MNFFNCYGYDDDGGGGGDDDANWHEGYDYANYHEGYDDAVNETLEHGHLARPFKHASKNRNFAFMPLGHGPLLLKLSFLDFILNLKEIQENIHFLLLLQLRDPDFA